MNFTSSVSTSAKYFMKYVKLEIFWCKNVLPNIFVMCQRFTDITVIFQPAEQTDKMHIFFL